MHSYRLVSAVTLLLLANGCASRPHPVSRPDPRIDEHRAAWIAAGIDDYRLTFMLFYNGRSPEMVIVEVRDGQPVSHSFRTVSGSPEMALVEKFDTVDELFDFIEARIESMSGPFHLSYGPDGVPRFFNTGSKSVAVGEVHSVHLLPIEPL